MRLLCRLFGHRRAETDHPQLLHVARRVYEIRFVACRRCGRRGSTEQWRDAKEVTG